MKLIAAGVGGAFAPREMWQTNYLLQAPNDEFMAVDMGSDARHSFTELPVGLTNMNVAAKLTAAWLSHLHDDHSGGFGWRFLLGYFMGRKRLKLFAIRQLIDEAWDTCWRGGLRTIENGEREAILDDFADPVPLEVNDQFCWNGVICKPVQTLHVVSGRRFQHSYGLLMEMPNGVRVFLTTDTQFAPAQLTYFYDQADIVIHDCETAPYKSRVHAHYDDLVTLDAKHKRKMWLIHYNSPVPEQDAYKDGFAGFVQKGQVFDFTKRLQCDVVIGGMTSKVFGA